MNSESVRAVVPGSLSKMEVLSKLGYEDKMRNYIDLTNIIKKNNIDISHFIGIKATEYFKK
jgi:hypothetical protein